MIAINGKYIRWLGTDIVLRLDRFTRIAFQCANLNCSVLNVDTWLKILLPSPNEFKDEIAKVSNVDKSRLELLLQTSWQ